MHEPYKRHLTTRFAKMILTPRSALKVHEPYIRHESGESAFTRAFIIIQALVCQNGFRILGPSILHVDGFNMQCYFTGTNDLIC